MFLVEEVKPRSGVLVPVVLVSVIVGSELLFAVTEFRVPVVVLRVTFEFLEPVVAD